eukprot:TRINITY_DN1325_c0_g1_i1.p1 TRINITY_DN1325_c0_g1~~TRINITY_DN1325_c0_g1_i1.p1  ORF type:complete len:157 (+),score=49.31 TRINITY_DN1325_c0_g1_i1:366-836(+)
MATRLLCEPQLPPIPGAEVEDSDDDVQDVELPQPKARGAQEVDDEKSAIVKQEIVKKELFTNPSNDLPPLLPGIVARENADLQSLFSQNNHHDTMLDDDDSDSEKEEDQLDNKTQPMATAKVNNPKDSTTTVPPDKKEKVTELRGRSSETAKAHRG